MVMKINFSLEIYIDHDKCIGCGTCEKVCPSKLYYLKDRKAHLVENYRDNCFICHACSVSCPVGAIVVEEDVR